IRRFLKFELDTYLRSRGAETPTALAEEIDVGAFTEEPGRGAFKSANVLAFEKRAIASGEQTVTLRGLKVPAGATLHVGIDPYNKRIDRNSSDNVVKAAASSAKGS
ncbi:MAG: hypothetical protein EBZ50_04260, partial [Alphaproteobacteria bacterium]|nr:hypothetical protein [Alphaproteobacteria bacterium]